MLVINAVMKIKAKEIHERIMGVEVGVTTSLNVVFREVSAKGKTSRGAWVADWMGYADVREGALWKRGSELQALRWASSVSLWDSKKASVAGAEGEKEEAGDSEGRMVLGSWGGSGGEQIGQAREPSCENFDATCVSGGGL